jgi:hypothetical protein
MMCAVDNPFTNRGAAVGAAGHTLGTVQASEQLITDLYINLKRTINAWAAVTQQTAQARMGYVGQHLVSVVTGYPGSKSGARGKDLVLPGGEFGEVKTCYRVDQLGKCNGCGAGVASIETKCPKCGCDDLKRNDDSKWLISIRHEEELDGLLDPRYYFLVLFDFVDMDSPDTIRASVWQVDPHAPGFALALVDYYFNIRANSKSRAPLNLWPYQLKFDAMRPLLIYRSLIKADDSIETQVFPGRDEPVQYALKPLPEYSRTHNLTAEKTLGLARRLGIRVDASLPKAALLAAVQEGIEQQGIDPVSAADSLALSMYLPDVEERVAELPSHLQTQVQRLIS